MNVNIKVALWVEKIGSVGKRACCLAPVIPAPPTWWKERTNIYKLSLHTLIHKYKHKCFLKDVVFPLSKSFPTMITPCCLSYWNTSPLGVSVTCSRSISGGRSPSSEWLRAWLGTLCVKIPACLLIYTLLDTAGFYMNLLVLRNR